jgi:hypothetical protein
VLWLAVLVRILLLLCVLMMVQVLAAVLPWLDCLLKKGGMDPSSGFGSCCMPATP